MVGLRATSDPRLWSPQFNVSVLTPEPSAAGSSGGASLVARDRATVLPSRCTLPATRAVTVGATESTNTIEGRSTTLRPARLAAATCHTWRPCGSGEGGTNAVAAYR